METKTETEIIKTAEELKAEKKLLSKEKRKAYMRNYKKTAYHASDTIKTNNRDYYYKYRYNLSSEDMIKYKNQLPKIAKLRILLNELKTDTDKELMKQLFAEFV